MAMGSFFAGAVQGFSRSFLEAQRRKQDLKRDEEERKAKLKLFDIQMQKEQFALKREEAAAGQAEKIKQAQDQLFAKLGGGPQQSQAPQDGIGGMLVAQNPVAQQAAPQAGMSLTDLLADPQNASLLLQSGMVDAGTLLKMGKPPEETEAIRTLRAMASDPALMQAEIERRRAGSSQTNVNLGAQGLTPPPTGYFRPNPTKPGLQLEPGGPVVAETNKSKKEINDALAVYEQARAGLMSGLGETVTGPMIGKLPAITSKQQVASGSVAAMAPVLKQLFRAAGEGVFTDKDQQLLIDMIPTRDTLPAAREALIQNIDNIIKAKLGLSTPKASGRNPQEMSNEEILRALGQ